MSKKPLEIDMIAGSQIRDIQGEMLDVEGADITDMIHGRGRYCDNHGKGFFNSIGRIVEAKKIFKSEDCENDRHKYYWEKVKSPFIYTRGFLYDDEDHPNARAAAAILRNIHKADCPLKIKASVEGGVVQRGIADPSLLARTKIHSVALTFTPANQATLVEPLNLEKSDYSNDLELIKSVMHLARTDIPSFRHITRHASAEKISDNINQINTFLVKNNINSISYAINVSSKELLKGAIEQRVSENIQKIQTLVKALTASGTSSSPCSRSGGAVLQTESLDSGRSGFKYITCSDCGKEQVYLKHQVKCRNCSKSFPMASLYNVMVNK